LVAVLLAAAFSLQSDLAGHNGGRPIVNKPSVGRLGERLNAIAIASNNPNLAGGKSQLWPRGTGHGLTDSAMLA
jgi:hypothetical protein